MSLDRHTFQPQTDISLLYNPSLAEDITKRNTQIKHNDGFEWSELNSSSIAYSMLWQILLQQTSPRQIWRTWFPHNLCAPVNDWLLTTLYSSPQKESNQRLLCAHCHPVSQLSSLELSLGLNFSYWITPLNPNSINIISTYYMENSKSSKSQIVIFVLKDGGKIQMMQVQISLP